MIMETVKKINRQNNIRKIKAVEYIENITFIGLDEWTRRK